MKMGLFDRFRSKRTKAHVSPEEHRRLAAAFCDLRTQVSNLDAQIATVHLALHRHEDDIAACKHLTDRHEKALTQLEQIVNTPPAQSAAYADRLPQRSVRPIAGAANPPAIDSAPYPPARRLDIDRFSEQQKRMLAVFFQNRDRQMSYADLAAVLGKSAYTVKNQMNLIRHKADLFDCTVGPESRHFFKLKDDLKVEKQLRAGRLAGRPVSITESDRTAPERETTPAEPTFSHPLF